MNERTINALKELEEALAEVNAFDTTDATHDQIADTINANTRAGEIVRTAKANMESAVLLWLHENKARLRRVVVGDFHYYGELEKKVKCLDAPRTLKELVRARLGDTILARIGGDLDALDEILASAEGLFRDVLSSSGLRDGAVRGMLAEVGLADSAHYLEEWPEDLAKGPPKEKLGVANLRFIHRAPGASKKELEARA